MNPSVRRPGRLALACLAFGLVQVAPMRAAAPGDASWKIFQTTKAIYPTRQLQNAVTKGQARVRVSIDAQGKLLDALVISCSHRDFGDEALRVIKLWRYAPALERGEPIGVVGDVTFSFVANGVVAVVNNSSLKDIELAPTDPLAYGAESMKSLDRIPAQRHVVPPVYPQAWMDQGIVGAATVEFFIDETGQARIPFVIAADQPLLGAAAVAAVMQWRFDPPLRKGKPVLVRAQQVFTFDPPPKKS